MWFVLQIQVHSCLLIARSNVHCHRISDIDKLRKCKRKYFQRVRAFSCVIRLNAQWCQLVPVEDSISLWWTSNSYISTQHAVHICYPLHLYLCRERWVKNVFRLGYICSCSVKGWHRLHSHGKSKSLPLNLNLWILHSFKLARNQSLIISQLFFMNLLFLFLSKSPIWLLDN